MNIRDFNICICLLQNDFTLKRFRQGEEKCCEVSQDTDAFFVHTNTFSASHRHPAALLWYMSLHLYISLYTVRPVSPVGMVLLLVSGGILSSIL